MIPYLSILRWRRAFHACLCDCATLRDQATHPRELAPGPSAIASPITFGLVQYLETKRAGNPSKCGQYGGFTPDREELIEFQELFHGKGAA